MRAKKKRKNKGDLRNEILAAAKKLFLDHGYLNTSMRKIAAKVGISPTTIYLYYQDKADVIHALHQEGFKILSEQFKILENVEHPLERLKAMGRCYINFALENRDFYELMFIMQEPLAHLEKQHTAMCNSGWKEGEKAFKALLAVIKDCQKRGYFEDYHTAELALWLWANLHGMCALKNNGHLDLLTKTMGEEMQVSKKVIYKSFELYVQILQKD